MKNTDKPIKQLPNKKPKPNQAAALRANLKRRKAVAVAKKDAVS